jgi:PKHD-type hydroxylase
MDGVFIMSVYRFSSMPSFGLGEEPFVTWNDGFDDNDIALIDKMSESRQAVESHTGVDRKQQEIRVSDVTWIECSQDSEWLYDRLAYISNQLNGQFYRFDLFGFQEDIQYTTYDSITQGHYTWHVDGGISTKASRKLSVVLQLSDPSEYEGGDLELMVGVAPLKVDKKKGLITAFPSYVLHRVTPVTKGIRKSLVIWCVGPAFK